MEGQAADQHRVHDGEHRGVQPDAQPEGEQSDQGEPPILDEHADGVSQVVHERPPGCVPAS